jgi:hypothetical protein
MDPMLLDLVEDFVPSAGVEPIIERPMALAHVAGDQILDRPGLVAALSYWASSIPGIAPIVPHRIAPASRSPWF